MKKTTKLQTKPPVDREAVRVLAIELGARETARRLGLNPNTVLSWSKRYNWELPNRRGGATKASANAITLQSKPGNVLIARHKELEDGTKTALMQTLHRASQAVARKGPLDISNIGQFRDACLSAARMFGWDGKASVTYYGDDNRQVIVCDEAKRKQLIEQRQRLLEAESERSDRGLPSQGKVIEIEAAVPVTIPAQEPDQIPVTPQDAVSQHMESIRTAATWKESEPEYHAGMFGPHPEEIY
jgi:transposase-like protein